jgi:hypothetical protein
MSKMASHEPFGHLQQKLWQKGPKVKLTIWLPTTKSQESIRPQCLQVECDISLERSQGELQVCFRPHPIGGLSKELWVHKVPRVQTKTVPRILLGNLGTKSHLDVGVTQRCKEYYMGEGGCGFPWVWAMVSLMSPGSPVVYPSSKGALESELTNVLVGLMQFQVSN